jgi:short-subunit dehydrogenase
MKIDRRSLGFCGSLAGVAALALAAARRQRTLRAAHALRGKVVLITGGSRGLGFAIASELSTLGARLGLCARDAGELERARVLLLKNSALNPGDVIVKTCDVSAADQVRSVVAAATEHFGQIDVVVNNAGIILVGPVESQTLDSFERAMQINFFGALHTTLAVMPQMLARGEGAIVNIASIGGKVAFPHLLPYVASKFALTGWSQGLRAELSGKGIRVTTVSPGVMRTGSHIQARYSGDSKSEYQWFASAASFPGTATDAKTAARKIVKALLRGSAEVAVGLQAVAASRLCNLSPELTALFLSTANRFLPASPDQSNFWGEDTSVAGKAYRGSLAAILERSGTKAIEEFNEGTL